jgi:hypothetical protein
LEFSPSSALIWCQTLDSSGGKAGLTAQHLGPAVVMWTVIGTASSTNANPIGLLWICGMLLVYWRWRRCVVGIHCRGSHNSAA